LPACSAGKRLEGKRSVSRRVLGEQRASPMSKSIPALLTLSDVAERWRMSVKSVRRLIAAKQLGVIRIGKALRVSESELVRFERLNSA